MNTHFFLCICKLYENLGHGKESMGGGPENASSHKPSKAMHLAGKNEIDTL